MPRTRCAPPPHPNSGLPEVGILDGRSRVNPTSAGEGLGVGVVHARRRWCVIAPPPSPTRGEGADRVCCTSAPLALAVLFRAYAIDNSLKPMCGGAREGWMAGIAALAAQPAPLPTNVVLYKKLNFDPAAFEPLAIMTSIPNTLTVRMDFPARSVAELIAYAKANPGKVNFGSQGVGTTPHLTGELFARVAGTRLTHVPYRGTAQAVNDLVAGNIDMLFFQLDSVREQYRANKVKMLAVTTAARIASVPEVPTMEEAGVEDFRSDSWNALAAPPKTPAAIIAKLNDAINAVLKEPEAAEHLRSMNMTPVGGAPDAAKIFIRQETERWGDVIRAAKISLD